MRTCAKCHTEKPLTDFTSGAYRCRPCAAAYARERYAANLEASREYSRAHNKDWREAYPERFAEKRKAYLARTRERDREKTRARQKRWELANPDKVKANADRQRQRATSRFGAAKRHARACGREFALTPESYAALISKPCAYCKRALAPKGIGLDRMDNARGYTEDNVVPCCPSCNSIKSDRLTHAEMLIVGATVRSILDSRPNRKAHD